MQSFEKMQKRKKIFGQKKPRLFCTRMKGNVWRRKGTASHLSNMVLLCYGICVYACQWNRVTAGY